MNLEPGLYLLSSDAGSLRKKLKLKNCSCSESTYIENESQKLQINQALINLMSLRSFSTVVHNYLTHFQALSIQFK